MPRIEWSSSCSWPVHSGLSQGRPSSEAHPSTGACSWKTKPAPAPQDAHLRLQGPLNAKKKKKKFVEYMRTHKIFQADGSSEEFIEMTQWEAHCPCAAHSSWLKCSHTSRKGSDLCRVHFKWLLNVIWLLMLDPAAHKFTSQHILSSCSPEVDY